MFFPLSYILDIIMPFWYNKIIPIRDDEEELWKIKNLLMIG